jgi:DNA primase
MTSAEEIKSKLDIVDVIQEYVPLKAAGINFKANCPFHNEKSPSFMVSRQRQSWHCFGCGEGGDIFTFIEKQEGLEFREALRLLATKAGVQIKTESPQVRSERETIARCFASSVQYWKTQLIENSQAEPALKYVKEKRNINDESIKNWHLGFALNSWDGLVNYLASVGFKEDIMIKAGVAVKKSAASGRGVYDRFRNRIMFPLSNAHGQVVGATGRVMPGSDEEAKYVNTPESVMYHKGKILYGLDKAKQAIREQDLVVLVEGNVDVITSHQMGIKNVVAASGTALTTEQVALIKRYATRVAFAFDQDTAGQKATTRGILEALSGGLDVLIIELPKNKDGEFFKDPDECIQENPELWKIAVEQAKPLFEYYFEKAKQEKDLDKLENKRALVNTVVPILARVNDLVARSHHIKQLGELVGVPEEQLRHMLENQNIQKKMTYEVVKPERERKMPVSVVGQVSENLIAGLFAAPEYMNYVLDTVEVDMLDPAWQPLYKVMVVDYTENHATNGDKWRTDTFQQRLAEEPQATQLTELYDIVLFRSEQDFINKDSAEVRADLYATAKRLKKIHLQKQVKELERQIRDAEKAVPRNTQQLDELMRTFQQVSGELHKLDV